MSLRKISRRAPLFSAVLLTFAPLLAAKAQDVDVPGNLTMRDSTGPTVGNVLKGGVPFLHNFGIDNTFLGVNAGNLTMSGPLNTGIGSNALANNDAGTENTATGALALRSNTRGFGNTATGAGALVSNTTGTFNTGTGNSVFFRLTDGDRNTATGAGAMAETTSGVGNTATGFLALGLGNAGAFNTATGVQALEHNNGGAYNTAVGWRAMAGINSGNFNIAVGREALHSNTTGNNNIAVGYLAAAGNSTGNNNIAVGTSALFQGTNGSNNTAIGYSAQVLGGADNATVIGAGAIVIASNKIRFGNADVTVIEGQVPYTFTSDRNQKENFRAVDADEVLTNLRGLSVTSWNYKGQDAKQFRHYGPVAQDFFAAFGHDAVGTIGTPTTITSGDLDGILMIAVQALEKRSVEQEKEIADLKARLVVKPIAGIAPGTLVWKDATGEIVTGVTGTLYDLHFRDESGYFWRLSPSSLRIAVEETWAGLSELFQSDDCSGIAYFATFPSLLPRVTFTAPGDPTIRIRPDDLTEELIAMCSARQESDCVRLDPCSTWLVIRAAETVPPNPISPPTLSYVAPLHPELP